MPDATPEPMLPGPATSEQPESGGFRLPAAITRPIEAVLTFVGSFANGVSGWAGTSGYNATSRARPWLEFIDLSAFGLEDGGYSAYIDRLKLNAPYFMFNYVILGLLLTVLSVITKPLALFGALFLVWLYFQMFGVANADEELRFLGFSLDNGEKVGLLVIVGFVLFWFTAGGFGIFFSVLTAVAFVTLIHGVMRKPSPDAIPTF